MSVKYVPVQWNGFKYLYDAVFLAAAVLYLALFLGVSQGIAGHAKTADGAIHIARAFGGCAFLMLSVILAIGPLARIDRRFLPLLYNRRHFGVFTFLTALTHATAVVNWYFNFSPTPKLQALLGANRSYDLLLGFPIEALGLFALLSLAALAFTSHDFWLKFLTPRIWKAIHFSIYPAYGAVVVHVSLGALQDETEAAFAIVVGVSALLVCGLHLTAVVLELRRAAAAAGDFAAGWVKGPAPAEIEEGRGRMAQMPNGDRVAIFRHEGAYFAIAHHCAHQNGPLAEGRIVYGCVTCPWHGFQYDVRNGRSPPPFTEKLPTYNLRLAGGVLEVQAKANPPGTETTPVPAPEDRA